MLRTSCLAIGALLILLQPLAKADDVRESKSSSARAAKVRHDAELEAAERAYHDRLRAADEAYVKSLEEVIKQQTQAGNLDEALRLKAIRDKLVGDASAHAGRLTILFAAYGGANAWKIVTEDVRQHVRNDALAISAASATFHIDRDVAPGQWKFLLVVYQYDDAVRVYLAEDTRQDVRLPASDAGLILPSFRSQ